jgi:glycosyltransferase involved in cell wall biosynthesis
MNYPKISIVTPSYNQGQYLEQTILSVIGQNYPNLEYIIMDGGSTDNSVDVIKKYQNFLTYWISEPDNGMYEAINKGFQKSTGEIMGWINSDDKLHPNSLYTISEIFQLAGVNWITGAPTIFDESGRTINVQVTPLWSKLIFCLRDQKYIQQESTFWKRDLWTMAGNFISTKYKYAGDFELWNRFFKHEKLYSCNCLIGGSRERSKNQITVEHFDEYLSEEDNVIFENEFTAEELGLLRRIKRLKMLLRILKYTRILSISSLTSRVEISIRKSYGFPPRIQFDRILQKFYVNETVLFY